MRAISRWNAYYREAEAEEGHTLRPFGPNREDAMRKTRDKLIVRLKRRCAPAKGM